MDKLLLKVVNSGTDGLVRSWLSETFAKQLAEQGIIDKPKLIEALVERAISGGDGDSFTWADSNDDQEADDCDTTLPIKIAITPEDIAEYSRRLRNFEETLPAAVGEATTATAQATYRALRRRWPEVEAYRAAERFEFEEYLELRWNGALDLLRMLQDFSLELAEGAYKRQRRSRSKRPHIRRDVLLRLYTRACQVAAEIITLLESGYADGAMARWRTLHEIVVVALLIYDFGEDIAERYVAHEFVEAQRAAEFHERYGVPAGQKPMSKRARQRIQRDFDAAVQRYGKPFGSDHGWAAHHLKHASPPFSALETAAGRAALRTHYKMASYNVHAGPRGISFKLGSLDPSGMIAGASYVGLEEPGCNTAYAIAQMTMVIMPEPWGIAEQVTGRTAMLIRDAACRAFIRSARELDRDWTKVVRAQTR